MANSCLLLETGFFLQLQPNIVDHLLLEPLSPIPSAAIDPDIAREIWRKHQKRRKDIEEAKLARERAEDRAREIRRKELRDQVLGTTDAAHDVLIAAEEISADVTTSHLVENLTALANAKSNREVERLVVRTERAIMALQQHLKDVADEEDDLEIILRDLF